MIQCEAYGNGTRTHGQERDDEGPLTPEISEKLEAPARDTKRIKSYLASEAIASYIDRNSWQIEEIKRGLDEARSGRPGIPHQEVEKWVRSWGTKDELPRPTAKKS